MKNIKLTYYSHGDRSENKIALTFDDGPSLFWTRKILDILDKYDIKANFFVLGKWAERYRDIIEEILNRGHLIGNHSYSHSRYFGDFERVEEIIFEIIGIHTKFIRPPYLLTSLCNDYPPAVNGEVKIINCDIFPYDYKNKAEDIKQIIRRETQNGSIIVLHDGSDREEELKNRPREMVKALPVLIASLKKDFILVRIDELSLVPEKE